MTITTEKTDSASAEVHDNPLEAMAQFVVGTASPDIPAEVMAAAARGALDMLGCAVLGAREREMQPLLKYVAETYAPGRTTVIGLEQKLAPEASAYANSVAGHILDYDDCHDALRGHPTAAVLPAVLSLGEELGSSGSEVLAAYVIGVEVASVIGRGLHHVHYERGWHPTATLGIFGATAAAARLLGLSVEQAVSALGIASSFSSGIKGNFGTFMKSGQVGFAASNGVQAARLAQGGVVANPEVFTGGHSYPHVYNGTNDIDWSAVSTLGSAWNMVMPGIVFKLYACCGSTHAAIDAMREISAEHDLSSEEIAKVEIYNHPRRMPHTDRAFPVTDLQSKFSNQYAVAVTAMKRGAPTVADFTAEAVTNPEIQRLLAVTTFEPLPVEDQGNLPGRLDCFAARVIVETKAGERLEKFLPTMVGGDPMKPLPTDLLEKKFLANITEVKDAATAAALLETFGAWTANTLSTADFMNQVQAASSR
ncbi:MAG: MmgE/PrpD family protein [Marmoricola sp.]|jgi:2-methylcitrate dehydratase PrpD|nr:MmgE/PrpD family protein [Marmoricola sp.]